MSFSQLSPLTNQQITFPSGISHNDQFFFLLKNYYTDTSYKYCLITQFAPISRTEENENC